MPTQQNQRQVFIANLNDTPLRNVKDYGRPNFLTQGFVPLNDLSKIQSRIEIQLEDAHEEDFLLLNGNNIVSSLVFSVWIKKFNSARILYYDNKMGYKIIYYNYSHPSLENPETPQ